MEKKNYITLFFVVLLGFVLRYSWNLYSPPSLNWDEVSHGYNAYSILKTGMDQWGQKFPIFNFRAYGDYPTTLNLYLTIPFLFLTGLSEFSVRFPHIILGTLTIISAFYLSLGLTKRKDLSLLVAFLVAITPWYLFTSRFVLQSNLSVFLLITSGAFFVNRQDKKINLTLSIIFLFLSLFAYHTTRIFSPLVLLATALIYKDEIKNKLIYLVILIFIGLSALIFLNPNSYARAKYLSIFDRGAINIIEKYQNKYGRILVNKITYSLYIVSSNYISYFSPKFLFFEGGTQYQFSILHKGLIYPVCLPFIYLGLGLLIYRASKDKNYRLMLAWLLLSPIPASITNESYTVLRATTMLPITEILIGLGFYFVIDKLKKNINYVVRLIFIVVLFFSLEQYLYNYFMDYRTRYSWSWQYGYKEAVNYAQSRYDKYDKILLTKKYGEPHEYVLFFTKYDPLKYINDKSAIRFEQSGWWWVDKFDKYYFLNDWQVKDLKLESGDRVNCEDGKCLLITSPNNYPTNWNKLDTINFLDGKVAFEIYEN